jgi:hypothetical protein
MISEHQAGSRIARQMAKEFLSQKEGQGRLNLRTKD